MPKIKELLNLKIDIDIKNVIDLEDNNEDEIRFEIENYIVTENIGKHLSGFASKFNSNIKETGVWVSGFYGSGKSYFGKMLGYLLANKSIAGTRAIDRFIPRLAGLKDASLIENDLLKFSNGNNRVILLDIAKQNTDKGLAFTLFRNFLKNLGFLDSVYGYLEYQLYLDGEYQAFEEKVKSATGDGWQNLRKSEMKVPKTIRKVLIGWKYTAEEYEETIKHLNAIIESFSATKLKDELVHYRGKHKDETIIFIFDEASEAISQQKFTLLDLEGLSEALSGIASKVWTIAIAQEKLDDVINNSNISKSQLTKVTDRFKNKIHLESTDVDVIIRNRLLQKTPKGQKLLEAFYDTNLGKISDFTNLKGQFPTKSDKKELFSIYYPFHKYQFDLLQKFLFASKELTATQVAARGMIITTFDVLRNKLGNVDTFSFATAFDICAEAQTAPPAALVNKYDISGKVLAGHAIDGNKLLKAIHFLSKSEIVDTTAENIAKVYISNMDDYFELKPKIDEALDKLTSAKILLASNNTYKITSDQETKLLDEMNEFTVEHFIRKRELIARLQKNSLLKSISSYMDNNLQFNFKVISDLNDELFNSSNKDLIIEVCSLYNIADNRADFIESIKRQTQNNKSKITLIPNNSNFNEIHKLIEEIQRLTYMSEKYSNDSDNNIKQIIREFGVIQSEKEKNLLNLINHAYANSTAVYLFNTVLLNDTNFNSELKVLEKMVLDNVYNKRPTAQLSEFMSESILKEKDNLKLVKFNNGNDFKFFDANGNFIGESLPCIEAVTNMIKQQYRTGNEIELELKGAPTGYNYGTVSTLIAVLFRAGRLTAKYNGNDLFSYLDNDVQNIFRKSTSFSKASFKSLSKALTTSQKNDIVIILRELKVEEVIKEKVDWNTSDIHLMEATRTLAESYINAVETMAKTIPDFEKLFGTKDILTEKLHQFSSKVNESNFIETAESFLLQKDAFAEIIKKIEKIEKFIKSNLPKAREIKRFVDELKIELDNSSSLNAEFNQAITVFESIYAKSVVDSYKEILSEGQKLKDAYHKLMVEANKQMTTAHTQLRKSAQSTLAEIKKFPEGLNQQLLVQVKTISEYADKRCNESVGLDYTIKCSNCHFSLSEMISYTALVPTKLAELQFAEMSIVKVAPQVPTIPSDKVDVTKTIKKLSLKIDRKTTVGDFKKMLQYQLQQVAGMQDKDEIEIEL